MFAQQLTFMQSNVIFSQVIKYMETMDCIYFKCSDPNVFRGSVPSAFLKNLTDKTGTPANLITLPFDIL